MTDLKAPSPSVMSDEIVKQLKALKIFKDVDYKHGKFRIEDLDQISFRTPAAFVSITSGDPQLEHSGDIRLACQLAIMLVTKQTDRNADPWALSVNCLDLIRRNVWGMEKTSQPNDFKIIPVISGSETKKRQALTAFTWAQDMTILQGPDRSRSLHSVQNQQGEEVWNEDDPNPNETSS